MPSAANGNLLGVNPEFVNPANGDFRLEPGSPAAGTGYQSDGAGRPRNRRRSPTSRRTPGTIAGFATTSDKAVVISKGDLLANDSDPDGDALAITSVSGAQGGSVSLTSGGDVRFTPNSGFDGTARFTYSVSDGNGGTDQAQVSIDVSAPNAPPPNPEPEPEPETGTPVDLWSEDAAPDIIADQDRNPVQLGLKFQSSVDGMVTAVQFYQGQQTDGENIVHLWNAEGVSVASGTFGDDGSTGWKTVYFDEPVAIVAGEVWTASYHAPQGGYAVSQDYFDDPWTNGPLTALEDGGVYAYGSANRAPTESYRASNYWLDVIFLADASGENPPEPEPNAAPDAMDDTGLGAISGETIVIAGADLLSNDSDPDGDALAITSVSGAQGGSAILTSGGDVRFTPDIGFVGTAKFTYAVSDGNGGSDQAEVSIVVSAPPVPDPEPEPNAVPDARDDAGLGAISGETIVIAGADLLNNDSDPDGDALAISSVSGAQGGNAILTSGGDVRFTPDLGFVGTAKFTYRSRTETAAPTRPRSVWSYPRLPSRIPSLNPRSARPSISGATT